MQKVAEGLTSSLMALILSWLLTTVQRLELDEMRAAMRGGDLGPEQFEQEQVKQTSAMQQLAAGAGQQKAAQAQAAKAPVNAPAAPTGTAGVTALYPAQASPGAVPTTGKMPSQPNNQGHEEDGQSNG